MKRKKFHLKLLILPVLIIIGLMSLPDQGACAATPVQICAVSYTDESILVLNNGNSRIYYATELDASKNNWDVIYADASDEISVIDISWLSANTESILKIKGDSDSTQARLIIKKKPEKLEVAINYSLLEALASDEGIGALLNIRATEGTGDYPLTFQELQWKKGEMGRWMNTELLTKGLLESYLIKGTNLYFRIAPKDDVAKISGSPAGFSDAVNMFAYTKPYFYFDNNNDGVIDSVKDEDLIFGTEYPDGTGGRRAGNEVKLKITKQSSLPVAGVDGDKFNIDIKYGQEYRVTVKNSTTPDTWTKITDRLMKRLPLSVMLGGGVDGLTNTTAFPEMKIEIREYATNKSSASKITETNLSEQRKLTGEIIQAIPPSDVAAVNPNIYITYNGTKNLNVTIPSASAANPYEYCVIKQSADFDLAKATWTTINKNTMVKILSSKAVDYGTLYIRMKEIKYKAATASSSAIPFQLASTMVPFPIRYPSAPTAAKTTQVYTKGYPSEIKITVTLNAAGKMPFETELMYIKLGTRDVPIASVNVSPVINGTIDPNTVYTMTILLDNTELEKMPNSTARALSIYYKNGTVDKTSTKLTIKNPTAAFGLTTNLAPGTAVGTTALTVVNPIATDNTLVYQVGATEVTGVYMEDIFTTGSLFISGMDVTVAAGDYLTIYEINATTKNVVKYKSVKVTADKIKQ